MAKSTHKKEPLQVSRRGFVAGSAAVAATAMTLEGCSSSSGLQGIVDGVKAQFPDAHVEYLDVDFSQILPHAEMNMVDSVDYLYETKAFDLPLGSLVYQSSDSQALVMAKGASSKALIRLGFVSLDSGTFTPVLEEALGVNEDFIIYDARASAEAVVWVECNMVHGQWRVFATHMIDGMVSAESMKQALLLDEGEDSYSPPQLAASGKKVYWSVMPDPDGPASSEDSYLKAVTFASGKAGATATPEQSIVFTSHGRMITNPTVSGGTLTIVPRVDTDGVYYQLTAIDIESDEVRNISILPPSLRVANAVWLEEGFAFGIEGNYDYAKGLSLFGTYQQMKNEQFLYINKVPAFPAVQMNALTYIKSTKNVIGLDTDTGTAVIVGTPKDCVSYGDILAGTGVQNRLVTYTTIVSRVVQNSGICHVRVFDYL